MNFLSLLNPTSFLLAMAVVLSISNAVFINLYSGAKDDLATVQATLSSERDQAKFDAQQAKERADRTTADVSKSWAAALDHLRKSRPIRVLPAADCDLPHSDAGTTGESSFPGLKPAPSTTRRLTCEECEQVANDAVSDAAQLMHLIDWVQRQRGDSE